VDVRQRDRAGGDRPKNLNGKQRIHSGGERSDGSAALTDGEPFPDAHGAAHPVPSNR
jgi:hypothetical protein